MEIRMIDKCYIGFIDELSVKEVYKDYLEFFNGHSVLITCLDSNRNTKDSFSKEFLSDNKIDYEIINTALFLKCSAFQNLLSIKNILPGFTELYLFKNNKPIAVPEKIFTSDGIKFDGLIRRVDLFKDSVTHPGRYEYNSAYEMSCNFLEIMNKIGAERYLSDGCGLNLASSTPIDINRLIEIQAKYSNSRRGQSPKRGHGKISKEIL